MLCRYVSGASLHSPFAIRVDASIAGNVLRKFLIVEPLRFISTETRPPWHEDNEQEHSHTHNDIDCVFEALLVPADSKANNLNNHNRVNWL